MPILALVSSMPMHSYAQVFVMRHQMSLCRFPSFRAGSFLAFWNPKKLPAAFLLHTNRLVQYQSNSRNAISREQLGYYRFLLCTQGTFSIRPRGIILTKPTQCWYSWTLNNDWNLGIWQRNRFSHPNMAEGVFVKEFRIDRAALAPLPPPL